MKRILIQIIAGLIVAIGIVLGVVSGVQLTQLQKETLLILCSIAGVSALYCFLVGEITGNNSQMDRLWSILPIAYVWVVLVKSQFDIRLVVFVIIVTLWGMRLTYNFGRKGAYSLKFWAGEEDYRWSILRSTKYFKNKFVWATFDLIFISIYQNFIVLAITFPAVACMQSTAPFGIIDVIVSTVAVGFLALETMADENQWKFHKAKKHLLKEGKQLSELPTPYNKGFNTTGIWGVCRHPNYLGEQGVWLSLYFFCVGAGVVKNGIFNWSIIGSLLLILLFMGSSTLGEAITTKKYPEYAKYQKQVYKYLPIHKYQA